MIKIMKALLCVFLCAAMITPATRVEVVAVEQEATNLLTNGTFADANTDGKADSWTYWPGTSGSGGFYPASTSINNGLVINATSATQKERLTVHQSPAGFTAGDKFVLTGMYRVTNYEVGRLRFAYSLLEAGNKQISATQKTIIPDVQKNTLGTTGADADGWVTFTSEEFVVPTEEVNGKTPVAAKLEVEVYGSAGAKLTAEVKYLKLVKVEEPKPEAFDSGLLVNGGFTTDEDANGKVDGWEYWNGSSVAADSIITEDGLKVVADRSENGANERLTIKQSVTDLEKGTYKLTGKFKVYSKSYGAVNLYGYSSEESRAYFAQHTKEYTDWQSFEKEIVVKADGAKITVEIEITNGAQYTAEFSEFKLEKVEVEEANEDLLVNGSFKKDEDTNGKSDGWEYWNGSSVAAESTITEDGLKVVADRSENGANERLTIKQSVTDLEKGTYKLTGKFKVYSKSYGAVNLYGYSSEESRAYFAQHTKEYTDWQSFEKEIVVKADGAKITVEIEITNGAQYTAEFSEFKLVKVETEEEDDNLIVNSKYEDVNNDGKADNWNYYSNKGNEANYESSSKDGVFTAIMKGTGTLVLHQTIKLNADGLNKKYRFTGEVKTTDLTNSYASFRIQLVNASNSGLGTTESDRYNATTEWQQVTIDFEVPETSTGQAVAGIKVEHYINAGTGTVEFRNVKLIETGVMENLPEGDPIDTLIYNGGYEKTASGMPASWSLWQSTGGLKATSDRTVKYGGYSSLHIENVSQGNNSRGSVHQTFTVTEELKYLTGQSLLVRQYVKTEGFVGSGVTIRIHDPADKLGKGTVVATKTIPLAATQDWTYYEYILDLPTYALDNIKVEYLYDNCQGDVWIDNTEVYGYVRGKGVEVEGEPFVLQVGDEHQIKLTFNPVNTTDQKVTFTNSNDDVITVDEQGLIKAVANGTSTITITQADGIKKEVAVLVTTNELEFNEEIKVETKQNQKVTGQLPAGYTYEVVAAAQHGTFIVEDGTNYIYYPNTDFVGKDSVTLLVKGAARNGAETLVNVEINVAAVNAEPNCDDFNVLTNVNETATGKITVTDPENDEVTFEVATQPQHGTLTITGVNYTFVPETDYTGYDVAIIHVKDGHNTKVVEAKIYIAASVEDILATVKDGHSILLADDARFEELKELVKTDENAKAWLAELVEQFKPILADTTPVPFETPDGLRLNTQGSKDVLNMAFMYRITGDLAYFERACLELNSLCNIYPDWNPVHLLDTAMTANGVAIAYDWLYDTLKELKPELLADVEEALYKFGLQEALKQFEANHMFVTNLNNWNYVCNGGFATTALALAHHENEAISNLAGDILQRCYKSIQYGLPQYAPEGDSIEGISYWDYGTRYLVSCLASISSATNVENPFISAPGLYETAQYPIYMTGKAGTYNYSDNDMTPAWGYLNLWLANEFERPDYTWYHKDYVANGGEISVYDLLYYYPEQYEADAPTQLDKYYTSQAVTTMRHDFEDANSSFVGFKGGENGAAHGDLDIGSFIYDIFGERWAFDFGKEDYNLPGYWEIVPGGTRWNYYRKNALGHNTLVINPTNGANQKVGAYSGAIEQVLNDVAGGYTILDMSEAYQDNAVDVKRGFAYINRTQVLIRDEFTLKAKGEIYWQMHTTADVAISEDGTVATLTIGNKSIEVRLLDDTTGLKFETMDAVAYEGLKTYEGETSNEGVTKLYIKASGVQKGTFTVLLTPTDGVNPVVEELANWKDANADYSNVETALAIVEQRNPNFYTEESFANLLAAVAKVVEDRPFFAQEEVDNYAQEIMYALEGLEILLADYSEVDALIESVPADLSVYTEESVKVLKDAIAAVERGLYIPQQETVDGYADAIAKAIDGLVKVQEGGSADTSDNSYVGVFAGITLLSLAVIVILSKKRKESN